MSFKKIVATILLTCSLAINVYANELPVADGYDLNTDSSIVQENLTPSTRVVAADMHTYSTSAFKTGVYLKGGSLFPVRTSLSPYMREAVHTRSSVSDPNVYKVTYQMLTTSGAVRQGIPFVGNIDKINVSFTVKENNNFYFYIAGDGTNTYTASGTLVYKFTNDN